MNGESNVQPVASLEEWLQSASDIRPQWRARRQLRQSLIASPDLQAKIGEMQDPKLDKYIRRLFDHPYWSFEPRPNNVAVGDEQTSFLESQALTTVCLGGNGCLAPEQRIFDPVDVSFLPICERTQPFHVISMSPDGIPEIGLASPAVRKGVADIYRVTLSSGSEFLCTGEHQVLTPVGMRPVCSLFIGDDLVPSRESVHITSIERIRFGEFYDITVHPHHNYLCAGVFHRNSGKSYIGSQRLIKFCCEEQAPPIKDTPFFIIATSLQESQRTCWAQHLYNLLPEEWVDWNRIVYESRKLNFPKIVPLMPWADRPDKNWTLYFCGYSQDREAFQSVAAGGAWFTEQCDYDIYEEVMFRMRRYMFPGSIWMEFTPIDPHKSVEIKQRYEDWSAGKLDPAHWQFARLNTEVAAKHGHIKQEVVDQAKASMSSDMLQTRLYGMFAGFEGAVYPDFNSRVHLIPNDYYGHAAFNPDWIHKRGVDWGSGPENAFVVIWLQKDSLGRYWVYDEYYTTETNTWEDRARAIHKKDGWNLVAHVDEEGHTHYSLEPLVDHPRWQYGAANFGATYAPPDDPGLFREMGKYQFPCAKMKQGYELGIDAITRHLKFDQQTLEMHVAPRLFIDKEACPNLSWELPALQWQQMPNYAVNPRVVKRYQKKIKDHACTVAGAPILTFGGWKPIIEVTAGEMVASEKGWSRVVTGCIKTRVAADLVSVSLSCGEKLICTPDHRLKLDNGDWVDASESSGRSLMTWGRSDAMSVLSVEAGGIDDTYCIAVEDGSMVWSGGVIASNCDALRAVVFSDWMENSSAGIDGFWRQPKERPQVRYAREQRRR